jgi:hypothetical protein
MNIATGKGRVIGSTIVQKTTISCVREQCAGKSFFRACRFFDNYTEEQRQSLFRMLSFLWCAGSFAR